MLYAQAGPPWLVLLLGDHLGGAWLDCDPGRAFRAGGRLFRSLVDHAEPAAQSFPAFFDRLHNEGGQLVGFQVTPVAWWDLPLIVGHLRYAEAVDDGQRLRVFISESVPAHLVDMGDQAFGGAIYQSDDGDYAITMDTLFLESGDLDILRRSPLNWETATLAAPEPR